MGSQGEEDPIALSTDDDEGVGRPDLAGVLKVSNLLPPIAPSQGGHATDSGAPKAGGLARDAPAKGAAQHQQHEAETGGAGAKGFADLFTGFRFNRQGEGQAGAPSKPASQANSKQPARRPGSAAAPGTRSASPIDLSHEEDGAQQQPRKRQRRAIVIDDDDESPEPHAAAGTRPARSEQAAVPFPSAHPEGDSSDEEGAPSAMERGARRLGGLGEGAAPPISRRGAPPAAPRTRADELASSAAARQQIQQRAEERQQQWQQRQQQQQQQGNPFYSTDLQDRATLGHPSAQGDGGRPARAAKGSAMVRLAGARGWAAPEPEIQIEEDDTPEDELLARCETVSTQLKAALGSLHGDRFGGAQRSAPPPARPCPRPRPNSCRNPQPNPPAELLACSSVLPA
jgi:hypothetical protein